MLKKLIYFLIPIILFTNVNAKTMNPAYASINNNYMYSNGIMNTAYQFTYNVYSGGTAYMNLCISPAFLSNNQKYNYATIDICSNGSNTYSLTGGVGNALVDGSVDYTNQSCITSSGYKGYVNRVYVQLIDWEIPPGGADFAWTCFQLGQTGTQNYTSLNRFLNIQIKDENTYFEDYNQQSMVNTQTNINNNINNQTNAINNQTNAINNQTNSINNQTNAINNQTNTINNQTNIINDDSLPNTSNFLDDWTDLLLENNTINQILYLPVNLLTNIKSAFNGNCSNLTIPFGLTGGNETLTFNCWTIEDYLGTEITTLISSIIEFYLIYYFALFLWKFYDDFTSMKDTLSIILENPDGPLQKGEIE